MPAAWVSAGVGLFSALNGSKQSGSATSTQQNQLDPRIGQMLFGDNNNGLLSQYQGMLPQTDALKAYQQAGSDYLTKNSAGNMDAIHGTANHLMGGGATPLASAPAWAVGNQIQAPSQNGVDLSGSYNRLINGDAGANPYLTGSLQNAVDMTNASYQRNQTGLTNNLMRNVLPSIRSDSVLAGQYGGSRQGIAEGNALSDYTNQLTNANLTLGLGNSANTTGQQANAFNQGQDRSLAATQGLGAQQYGVAGQNAATKNAAEFMNVGNVQQNNMANQNAALSMNGMNNSAALGGAGLLGGLGSSAVGAATNDLQRAQQVNGLLSPYLGANSSSTTSQPLYQNTAGNVMGGALMGGQLGKMFGGFTGGQGAGSNPGSMTDLFSGFGGSYF